MRSADVSSRRHFAQSSLRYLVDWTCGLLTARGDQTPLHALSGIWILWLPCGEWRVAFNSVRISYKCVTVSQNCCNLKFRALGPQTLAKVSAAHRPCIEHYPPWARPL